MKDTKLLNRAYQLYAVLLVVWGAWSIVWALTAVGTSAMAIAAGWVALVVVGLLLTAGLLTTRVEPFSGDTEAQRRFTDSWLSGAPLYVYVLLLVGWLAVFVAWVSTRGQAVDSTIVTYGWAVIVVIGLAILVALTVRHRRVVAATVKMESESDRQ